MRSQTNQRLSYLSLFPFLPSFPSRRRSSLRLGCRPCSSESCVCARPSSLCDLFLLSFLPSFSRRLSFLRLGCGPCSSESGYIYLYIFICVCVCVCVYVYIHTYRVNPKKHSPSSKRQKPPSFIRFLANRVPCVSLFAGQARFLPPGSKVRLWIAHHFAAGWDDWVRLIQTNSD